MITSYRAAEARAIADYLVGINSTQALSIAAGQGIFSARTGADTHLDDDLLPVSGEQGFHPADLLPAKGHSGKGRHALLRHPEHKYETLPAATTALSAVTATGTVMVADVQRKEVNQEPPLLYDLTSLQKEASSKLGFSADKTLSIAQSLYEKR